MGDQVFAPRSQVQAVLEGVPQVRAELLARSREELREAVGEAFGFRSVNDFEVFDAVPAGGSGLPSLVSVRPTGRRWADEVARLENLFHDVPEFEGEVSYGPLAKESRVPLLRLHKAIAPACGAALADWFTAYSAEVEQIFVVRNEELRRAASLRAWGHLQVKMNEVFPNLGAQIPEELRQPPPEGADAEERLACCSNLFSRVLDEIRVRILPLQSRRVIANGTFDPASLRPGVRLLRVTLEGGTSGGPSVFLTTLNANPRRGDPEQEGSFDANVGERARTFTGHDLYYQVARFFRLPHVAVRDIRGNLVSLEKPHDPLLGHLQGSKEGICVDLLASAYEPEQGSFDHLYREVLMILGPRHFELDQTYRLLLPSCEEVLTTMQGNAIITTVIVIPVNFVEGRQMYLFRSPRSRQCKAAMRTFEEFKDTLRSLVHVYEQLTHQMSPLQAERLRGACAEGAPGTTPLASFAEGPERGARWSQSWRSAAGHSALGLFSGLQATAGLQDMLLDQESLFDIAARHDFHPGSSPPTTGVAAATSSEARRMFDTYGVDHMQEQAAVVPGWCRSSSRGDLPWADPWAIAVGGLVGALFGLLEGVYDRVSGNSAYNTKHTLILERMARRGLIGLGVSAVFHFLGRLLRHCPPDGRGRRLFKGSIPASQALVFLGTSAWAVCSHQKYMEASFMRRMWARDLNLAERQAAGIIFTSGLACSCSMGGYLIGSQLFASALAGGPIGAFAGSLVPMLIALVLTGLDWWSDGARRSQLKVAALQTLGLPEPLELGVDVFKPMLAARYKILAFCLHPDKNDSGCCDTTTVFNQVRLAKEILEQELQDYQSCPRPRMRRLFAQMGGFCGHRRDRYVSQHPSGVIMNILENGPLVAEDTVDDDVEAQFGPRTQARAEVDSITTVESRSVSGSPTMSPRSPHGSPAPSLHGLPETVPEGADEPGLSPLPPAFGASSLEAAQQALQAADPWVFVAGERGGGDGINPAAAAPASTPTV